jgi:hypothetical protein
MALKDYYLEKAAADSNLLSGPDSWAIEYIDITRTQSIMEAFDDDAGGFITVYEVNTFTQLRPFGWRYALSLVSEVYPFIGTTAFLTG